MKDQLQKELKEKEKPGVKPSKLKRSKSTGDIPKTPLPKSTPLVKSKSAQELEPSNSKIEQLESKISVLELKLETQARELVEKDIEIENLQKQLTPSKELEQSLTKRHQNLKD